jgi:hypothetical protein
MDSCRGMRLERPLGAKVVDSRDRAFGLVRVRSAGTIDRLGVASPQWESIPLHIINNQGGYNAIGVRKTNHKPLNERTRND